MASFETFREYLLNHLAHQLTMPVEGLEQWDIWLAIQERCPEAARIASDQWLKKDLLEEHLRNIEFVRNQNGDQKNKSYEHNEDYRHRWNSLAAQMQLAITKKQKIELDAW